MTMPTNHPPHDGPDGPDRTQKALPGGDAKGDSGPRVVDVEVLHGSEEEHNGAGYGPGHGAGQGGHTGQGNRNGGFFYSGTFRSTGMGNMGFGSMWTSGGDQSGCLAPCVTFALFMVCLAQFGFLAGIGFVVFHTMGSVMGVLRDLRQISAGRIPNPWPWRLGNWAVSFMLTAWLAGAFH
jgi:hypothetical protein